MSEIPLNHSTELTPSDTVNSSPGLVFMACCTTAGNVSLVLGAGTTVVIRIEVGTSFMEFAVKRVNLSGTTAIGTYYNLRIN